MRRGRHSHWRSCRRYHLPRLSLLPYYWYGLPGLLVLAGMIFRRRDRMFRRYGWWMMLLPAAAALCGIVPDLRRFGSYGKSQAFLEAARQDAGRVIPPVRQWYGTYGQWPSEQDLRKILPASVPVASFVSEGYFYLEVRAELHRPLVFYRFAPDGQEEGLLVWSKRFPAQELRVPVNFSYPDRGFRKKQ